jgi:hypothetical protein
MSLGSSARAATEGTGAGAIAAVTGGTGEVTVLNGGTSRKARVGNAIFVGDKITTEADQTVTLTLDERSEIVLGPNSSFSVDEYKAGQSQRTGMGLLHGVLRSIIRKVYREDESFTVKTPSSVMGVRGTTFFVSVDRLTHETDVHTVEGKVAFADSAADLRTPGKFIEVPKGQTSSIKEGEKMAAAAHAYEPAELHAHLERAAPGFVKELADAAERASGVKPEGGAKTEPAAAKPESGPRKALQMLPRKSTR